MNLNLIVASADEYFDKVGKKINYEDELGEISETEANQVEEIIACEAAIFLMRRTAGGIGHMIDSMASIRRDLITAYEKSYNYKYIEYNDFW